MDILAVSGSLAVDSYNTALLKSAMKSAPPGIHLSLFDSLADLPPFRPDVEEAEQPDAVKVLRQAFAEADAVIISTPEYAHGIPGVLKNALDWLVASGETVLKPMAVMSVSTSELGGFRAHAALVQVLHAMNSRVIIDASLNVPFAKAKFDEAGELVDPLTAKALANAVNKLVQAAKAE